MNMRRRRRSDGDGGGHDIGTTTNQHSYQQHSALLQQDWTQVSTAERIIDHARPMPFVFVDLSAIKPSRC